MEEADFLAELARCVPRLEEPCGIPSAPALLQLSRFAAGHVKVVLAGQGADEPHGGYGRHQAAAAARRHAARAARARGAGRVAAPARSRAPRGARRVAHLIGGRGDAERLLRLVEVSDDEVRARSPPRRGAEARGRAARARSRRAGRRAGAQPARAGALPRHAHVPARRDPDLQRQDVDGRRPRAARAVPRPRADALRGAHSRAPARAPARGQAPAPRGDGAAAAAADRRRARSTASPPRTTTGCAPRSARRSGAATTRAPSSPTWSSRRAVARLVDEHRARARRPQGRSSTACSSSPSGTAPSSRRGPEPVARVKRILYVHSRKASFVAIDREILAERLRDRGPLPAGPRARTSSGSCGGCCGRTSCSGGSPPGTRSSP